MSTNISAEPAVRFTIERERNRVVKVFKTGLEG